MYEEKVKRFPTRRKEDILVPRIGELFNEAERAIKRIEMHKEKLATPPINELRYAGFHLLEGLTGSEIKELEKAEGHCKRAIYDATEIMLLDHLESFHNFEKSYEKVAITPVIKDWLDFKKAARAAQGFIETVGQNGKREEFCQKCNEHTSSLKQVVDTLEDAR